MLRCRRRGRKVGCLCLSSRSVSPAGEKGGLGECSFGEEVLSWRAQGWVPLSFESLRLPASEKGGRIEVNVALVALGESLRTQSPAQTFELLSLSETLTLGTQRSYGCRRNGEGVDGKSICSSTGCCG